MPLPQDILNNLLQYLGNNRITDAYASSAKGAVGQGQYLQDRLASIGEKAKQSNERSQQIAQAFAGGKRPSPELMKGLLDEVMNYTPMAAGQITPAFWKRLTPEVKASLTYPLNEQPGLMRRALQIPKKIFPEAEVRPGNLGSAEHLTPDLHALRIKPPPDIYQPTNPIYTRALPKASGIREEVLAGTGTHELTHILQYPRVLATQPEDAATIGKMLNEIITEKDPWVNRSSMTRVNRILNTMLPEETSTSNLGNWGLTSGRYPIEALHPSTPTKYGGLAGPDMTMKDAYSRLTMDEGLATLAESVRDPRSDNMLRVLADRLGLGVVPKDNAAKKWPEILTRSGYRPVDGLQLFK